MMHSGSSGQCFFDWCLRDAIVGDTRIEIKIPRTERSHARGGKQSTVQA